MCASGQVKYLVVSSNVGQLADDYIHRPLQEEFESIYYYDMTSRYKKNIKVTDQNLLAHINSLKVIRDLNSAIYPK